MFYSTREGGNKVPNLRLNSLRQCKQDRKDDVASNPVAEA